MKNVWLLLTCLVLAGCELFGGLDAADIASYECGARWLCTDRQEYVSIYQSGEGPYRKYGFTLIARFENRLSVPVFLAGCGFYGVAPTSSSASGYAPVWACPGSPRIPIVPGGVRIDTLEISGPNDWQNERALGILEGDFRLYYDVSRCPDEVGCALEEGYRASNLFKVRLAG
jgi:hypothetical protein